MNRETTGLVSLLLMTHFSASAQSRPEANIPENHPSARGIGQVPRSDRNSLLAHEQLLEKARKGGIDLYFAGDSITRRWGTGDAAYRDFLDNWKANFHGWNAGNFRWGGDTVHNVLWRIRHGELDGVHPKVTVLLAGTNNLGGAAGGGDPVVEEVIGELTALLETVREKAPGATIILTAIMPRNDRAHGVSLMPTINRINERLARPADGKQICLINVNDKLADREGKLVEGMTVDGLHLSVKGYQIWADALKPVLTERLGPPAATDHAPAPTADPSAAPPNSKP